MLLPCPVIAAQPCSHLIKNGYNREGELVILTPYVGQLRRLTKAVAASNMHVILDDSEQLAQLEEAELAAAAAAEEAALAGAGATAAAAGLQRTSSIVRSSSSSSHGAAVSAVAAGASSGGVVVASMQSCLRLATIDNFQVGAGWQQTAVHALASGLMSAWTFTATCWNVQANSACFVFFAMPTTPY